MKPSPASRSRAREERARPDAPGRRARRRQRRRRRPPRRSTTSHRAAPSATIANDTSEVVSRASAPRPAGRVAAQRDQGDGREGGQLEADQPGAEVVGRGDPGRSGRGRQDERHEDGRSATQVVARIGARPAQQEHDQGGRRGRRAAGRWRAGRLRRGRHRPARAGTGCAAGRRPRGARPARRGRSRRPRASTPTRCVQPDQPRARGRPGPARARRPGPARAPARGPSQSKVTRLVAPEQHEGSCGDHGAAPMIVVTASPVMASSGPGAMPSSRTATTSTAMTSHSLSRLSSMAGSVRSPAQTVRATRSA